MVQSLSLDEDVPVLEAARTPEQYQRAAELLESATQAGVADPNTAYLLAIAYKRQGKLPEARAALRKIQKPDANVILQMAILSLREGQRAQAEEELARAAQMDPNSYPIAYNFLLTRITLGKYQEAQAMIPGVIKLALSAEKRRFLSLIQELLGYCRPDKLGEPQALIVLSLDSPLESLTQAEEKDLISFIRGLGKLDTTWPLIRTLANTRPSSLVIQEAYIECALARGYDLLSRCRWTETTFLLEPLVRERTSRRNLSLLNTLLGCCAYVTSDFNRAVHYFRSAEKLLPNVARVQQNLALTEEKMDEMSEAEDHWNRFLDLLGRTILPAPPEVPNYLETLEFESLIHLANLFVSKDRWTSVVNYLNRAHRLRPEDEEVLERLFFAYNNAKQANNARKTLERLRALRPNDPQMDLYELDLVEVRNLTDIERMLADIEQIRQRHPGDHRVEDRAVSMVGNVIPLMGNLCDQLTDQLNKVTNQVGNLPRHQIDWSALREIMRDLTKEFQKLRRITGKCLPLVTSDEHKRIINDLAAHIDEKIQSCRDLGA